MAIIAPLPWWRLPFAGALAYHWLVYNRCQLCGLQACRIKSGAQMRQHGHDHWFNRLQYLCQACHDDIQWQAAVFDLHLPCQSVQGVASSNYRYPLDQVMRGFKNSQYLNELPILVHAIRQLVVPKGCHSKNALIIRIPTTKQRIIERGFDPLGILTAYLSFHWQIPVFKGLQRYDGQHQQGLTKDERLANIKEAFFLTEVPKTKHLILFDDVVTTGATMQEAATILCQQAVASKIIATAILHGN